MDNISQPPTAVNVLQPPTTVNVLSEVLALAEKGIPIFPCKLDKKPAIPKCWEASKKRLAGEKLAEHARNCPRGGHGFHDATSDPEKIRSWWTRYPEAMIGMPTGKRSGYWVLDEDRPGALDELGIKMPETFTVKTQSDMQHLYLQFIEGITNSSGSLPDGIDVRGEGGYVIIPPSPGYEVKHRYPVAQAPDELVQMVLTKEPKAKVEGFSNGSGPHLHAVKDNGGPIYEGARNMTLTGIAGRLHDGTRSLDLLAADLLKINEARCVPPLDEAEVLKIARSINGRAPCKQEASAPDQDTLAFLRAFEELAESDAWKGHRRGRQSLLKTYILQARRYGYMVEDGVAISMSNMQAAEHNGVSDRAVRNNNRRLVAEGYIRHANDDRKPLEAGTIILLSSALSTAGAQTFLTYPQRGGSTTSLGTFARESKERPWTAPRARHSRGVYEGRERIGTIRRMGKSAEAAVDVLEHVGGRLQDTDLAEVLGMRVRDLYRQNAWLERLEEAAVVEITEGRISLTESWLESYNARREQDLEIEDLRRDLKRHNERREVFREGIEVRKLARVMGDEEIVEALGIGIERVRRHLGRKRVLERMEKATRQEFDGYIPDLEKIEEPEIPELTDEELESLEAIEEFEARYGAGSFNWTVSGYKEVFYQVERAVWPTQAQLERIRTYLDSVGARSVA